MKKIPTMFDRDWNGDRSRVLPVVAKGCEWVIAGEGVATRKLDGTCCMVRDGKLYKRRELRPQDKDPPLFELVSVDDETAKSVGWVPVGDGPEDRYHREAFDDYVKWDGTYELIGPKIQGNPEGWSTHTLMRHGTFLFGELGKECPVPRSFEGLREWLSTQDIEGIVFHHPDGRMAKIKLRDFGLKRSQRERV